jgi:hypothetical protein
MGVVTKQFVTSIFREALSILIGFVSQYARFCSVMKGERYPFSAFRRSAPKFEISLPRRIMHRLGLYTDCAGYSYRDAALIPLVRP